MANKIKIFHNPRCSKSRQTLALLDEHGVSYEVVEYLKNPPSLAELTKIADALKGDVEDMIRTTEQIYKSLKVKPATQNAILQAISKNPELLQRPIVLKGKKAVIGRPPENVLEII